jgi:hypothetical protein
MPITFGCFKVVPVFTTVLDILYLSMTKKRQRGNTINIHNDVLFGISVKEVSNSS